MAAKIVNPSFPKVNHELRFLVVELPRRLLRGPHGGHAPDPPGTGQPERGRQPLRRHHLSEGADRHAPARTAAWRRPAAGWPARVPEAVRVRECDLARSRARARRADRSRSRGVEPCLGRRGWPPIDPHRARRRREGRRPPAGVHPERRRQGSVAGVDRSRSTCCWGTAGGARSVPLEISRARTEVPDAATISGLRFVLPTGGGLAYGDVTLDDRSRAYLLQHVSELEDPVARGAAWVTLWEEMLEGRVQPQAFVDAALRALPREQPSRTSNSCSGYLDRAFWLSCRPTARGALVAEARTAVARGHRACGVVEPEVDVLLGVSVDGDDRRRRRLSRACVAAAGKDSRADAGRAGRSGDGARSRRQVGALGGGDSRGAARPVHESRSEGAVRVRDARALGPRCRRATRSSRALRT